jgi:Tetracyclin repressor-like, C-terminal domain
MEAPLLRSLDRLFVEPEHLVQRFYDERITHGDVSLSLLAGVADDPQLLALIQERAIDAGSAVWLTILGRAVARGEARPEALHPRVATAAVVLLLNEYVTRGIPTAPDDVLVEIVDEVYLPLVRGRGVAPR